MITDPLNSDDESNAVLYFQIAVLLRDADTFSASLWHLQERMGNAIVEQIRLEKVPFE